MCIRDRLQLSYAVTSRAGNAVRRNRIRRRLRAIFAELSRADVAGPRLPRSGAILVSADAPVATMKAPELRHLVDKSVEELAVQVRSANGETPQDASDGAEWGS